jgi:hypothetical protein
MVAPLMINILYDKSNKDYTDNITLIQKFLKKVQGVINYPIGKPRLYDIREPNNSCDIQIHIDIPIFSAVPWSRTNILFFTSNDAWTDNYIGYLHAFDSLIFINNNDNKDNKDNNDNKEWIETLKNNINKDCRKDNIFGIDWNTEWNTKEDNEFKSVCGFFTDLIKSFIALITERKSWCKHYPPVVYPDDCPPISIITPTYSRSKLIEIAFHNLLSTDYPQDKIEWVVIEDNETKDKMNTESIVSFQIQVPKIKLKYIPIEGRMSIGEKRNLGIENASNDIILFMDDDDHYPSTSFRRRVSWLLKGVKGGQKPGSIDIACCTTLALYDLKKGISAVNVPPYELPFGQRISEATLTFKKSAWLERKFSDVSISEGEEWISGREDKVIEIPPQQIIVAFTHDENKSGRRIPPSDTPAGCFWGFPKEYLIFIHKLAGMDVEVEGDKTTK